MQFSKKQILISVLGCHGSGKSTLLNALLDCKLVNIIQVQECFKTTGVLSDMNNIHWVLKAMGLVVGNMNPPDEYWPCPN